VAAKTKVVPRCRVAYTGHSYTPLASPADGLASGDATTGLRLMTGMGLMKDLGRQASRLEELRRYRAPWSEV
jgi:hypothetical protein